MNQMIVVHSSLIILEFVIVLCNNFVGTHFTTYHRVGGVADSYL